MTTVLRKRAYRTHPNGKGDVLGLDAGTVGETTEDTATFVITTGGRDRDGDVVDPGGIDFDVWAKSGAPVLFGHDTNRPPIGTALGEDGNLAVWREGDKWLAKVRFDMADPFAAHIARKCHAGILKGASISFIPVEHAPLREGRGHYFGRVTITELSIVPVPANAEALMRSLLEGASEVVAKSLVAICNGPDCRPPLPLEHRHKAEWRELQQFALFTKAATGRELTVDQARKALRRAKGSQADIEPTRGQPGEIDRTRGKEGGRGRAGGGTYTGTDDATKNAQPGDTVIARKLLLAMEPSRVLGMNLPGRKLADSGERLRVVSNEGNGWLTVINRAGVQGRVHYFDVRAAKLPAGTLRGGRKLSLQSGKCACKGKCGCKKEANVAERYDDDDERDDDRPAVVHKPSARVLAKLYKHLSEVPAFLEGVMPELDHPGVSEALGGLADKHCKPFMEALKGILEKHHPGLEMDDVVKGMEANSGTGGGYAVEPGEAGRVDAGELPDYDDDEEHKDNGREEVDGRYDMDEDDAGMKGWFGGGGFKVGDLVRDNVRRPGAMARIVAAAGEEEWKVEYLDNHQTTILSETSIEKKSLGRGRKSHGGGVHPAILARLDRLFSKARQVGIIKD